MPENNQQGHEFEWKDQTSICTKLTGKERFFMNEIIFDKKCVYYI